MRVEIVQDPGEVTTVELVTGTQEHINGTVTTAGSPDTITPTANTIRAFVVQNPIKGPNKNGSSDVLLISLDSGVTFFSLARGDVLTMSYVNIADIRMDSNNNGTNYEIILEQR